MASENTKEVLIRAVQLAAQCWDASYESAVKTAIRSLNPEDITTAKEYLARVDAAETLRDEVINLIHKHWPRDAPASTTAGAAERQTPGETT